MIGIDLISLKSKIHIHLKVSIFRYTMGNRCIFFVSIDYFANSISRQLSLHYDWLIEFMLSWERRWLVHRHSHIIMVTTKYLFYLSWICLAKFYLWLFAQPQVKIQLILRKDNLRLRNSTAVILVSKCYYVNPNLWLRGSCRTWKRHDVDRNLLMLLLLSQLLYIILELINVLRRLLTNK